MADDKYKWEGHVSNRPEAKLPQPPRQKPVDVYERSTASKVGGYLKDKVNTSIANAKAERAHNIEHKKALRTEYEKGELSTAFKRGAAGTQPRSNGSYKMSSGRSPASNDIFGGGIFGGGIAFGGFGAEPVKKQYPTTVTKVSKSGAVTIVREEIPQKKQSGNGDMFGGSFWGSPVGAAGGNGKKGEKHPYDIF